MSHRRESNGAMNATDGLPSGAMAMEVVLVLEAAVPTGSITDAEDYRRRFPDGRIGSDPSQANVEAGAKLVAAAANSGPSRL